MSTALLLGLLFTFFAGWVIGGGLETKCNDGGPTFFGSVILVILIVIIVTRFIVLL